MSSSMRFVRYDRPGLGVSEPNGESPTPHHIAEVLHEALKHRSNVVCWKVLALLTTCVVEQTTRGVDIEMALPRLTKLELKIMETLWTQGASSVREIQEAFPGKSRPAYTTVQTIVY